MPTNCTNVLDHWPRTYLKLCGEGRGGGSGGMLLRARGRETKRTRNKMSNFPDHIYVTYITTPMLKVI